MMGDEQKWMKQVTNNILYVEYIGFEGNSGVINKETRVLYEGKMQLSYIYI